MSIDALQARLAEAPLLKLLPLLILGILLHRYFEFPIWIVLALFVVGGIGALLLQKTTWLILSLTTAGYLAADLQPQPTPLPTDEPLRLELSILDDGARRTDRMRYEASIRRWSHSDATAWQTGIGRLWLYSDTTIHLQGGDRLQLTGKIYPFRSDSESFPTLMQMRGYVGRCYLTPYNLEQHASDDRTTLHLRASRAMRNRLEMENDHTALVRAMTVGDRNGISTSLRTAYSRSGTSHLLAVSGLHTGMVFLLVNLLTLWLPIIHRGHRLRNLLVIGAVWLFVATAGFPPSAVRAAVMCTVLQWALFTSSIYRAINGWAAAALLLLIIRPYWLFDISFQLSFLAVWAILVWGVPLCRLLHTRYRLLNWVVDAFVISLIATLATLPLVSHQFGMIPLLGVLINPPAILLGTWIVLGGLLLLLLPPLAPLLRPMVLQLATWQNGLVEWTASSEGSYLEYRCSEGTTWFVYALFLLLTLLAWCRDRKKSVHL